MLLTRSGVSSRPAGFRGFGRLGDLSTDAASWAASAASLPKGSFLQQVVADCAANPTPACQAASASWFSGPTWTQQDVNTVNASIAAGSGIPTLSLAAGAPPPPPSSPQFSLVNTSRGGTNFQVGDKWLLTIAGAPPSQPVYIGGTQNGNNLGQSKLGTTDGNGNFSTSGVMTSDNIGQWGETYLVGSVPIGSASFTVSQAPGPSGTQSTTPPDSTNPATGLQTKAPSTQPPPSAVTAPANTISLFGFSVPGWAVGAGALALLLLVAKGQG